MAGTGTDSLFFSDDVTAVAEFWRTHKHSICSILSKPLITHWMMHLPTARQWCQTYCNQFPFKSQIVENYWLAKSVTWSESQWASISYVEEHFRQLAPETTGRWLQYMPGRQSPEKILSTCAVYGSQSCAVMQNVCKKVLSMTTFIYKTLICPKSYGGMK